MKQHYYVNSNPQSTGEHEIHLSTCSFLPSISNRVYLGYFDTFAEAKRKAKELGYSNLDACYWCLNKYHKR